MAACAVGANGSREPQAQRIFDDSPSKPAARAGIRSSRRHSARCSPSRLCCARLDRPRRDARRPRRHPPHRRRGVRRHDHERDRRRHPRFGPLRPRAVLGSRVRGTVRGTCHLEFVDLLVPDTRRVLQVGPLGVVPLHQRQGVGIALMEETVRLADERGEPLLLIKGSPAYYGRFGFTRTDEHGIEMPPDPTGRSSSCSGRWRLRPDAARPSRVPAGDLRDRVLAHALSATRRRAARSAALRSCRRRYQVMGDSLLHRNELSCP